MIDEDLVEALADFGIDYADIRFIADQLYPDGDRPEIGHPAELGLLRSHLRALADALEDAT